MEEEGCVCERLGEAFHHGFVARLRPAPPNISWLSSFFDRGRSLMRADHETTVLIWLNLIGVGISV